MSKKEYVVVGNMKCCRCKSESEALQSTDSFGYMDNPVIYTVVDGRIADLGKFEGEAPYVPFYWSVFLNGFADRDDGKVLGFDVAKEDKEIF